MRVNWHINSDPRSTQVDGSGTSAAAPTVTVAPVMDIAASLNIESSVIGFESG